MNRRLRHLFIGFTIIMIMVSAACVVEPPVEDVSVDPTVDVEATVEARVEQKIAAQATWIPDWAIKSAGTIAEDDLKPTVEPIANYCTLSDGSTVPSGWYGKGAGDNYCNNCFCTDGMVGCTKMACFTPGQMVPSPYPTDMPYPPPTIQVYRTPVPTPYRIPSPAPIPYRYPPTPTPVPTLIPVSTFTPVPTATPVPAPSPTAIPTPIPTPVPTPVPTPIPTGSPSTITSKEPATTLPAQAQSQITPKISTVPTNIPNYDRDEWRHWTDVDRDCQNTRHEVLIAESLSTVQFKTSRGCQVASGLWVDPYTGQTIYESTKLDVDHMVPLKNAHISGGWAWNKNRKEQFANYMSDPAHLIAVTASANRKKGAKGPEDWKPTNTSYWCTYATDWIRIKTSWDLTFTAPEWQSLESMKLNCNGNNSNAAPVNVAPSVSTPIPSPTPIKQPSPASTTSHISIKIVSISCSSKPEVVEIKNSGSQIINLTGWSLVDEGNKNKMLFPTGFTMPVGLTLTVLAGTSGEDSGNTLYWSGRNVLNNDGDTAFLFNSSNELVSKMSC